MTPEQIASRLVADGFAHRAPVGHTRCWRTIELRAIPTTWGRLYVTTAGEIRFGHTLKSSQPASTAFQQQIADGSTEMSAGRFTAAENRGHLRAANVFTYRGYAIEPDRAHPYGGWCYIHRDYDGAPRETGGQPADPRCGHAATIDDATVEIDDLHETYPEKHGGQFDHYPLACHGHERN